MSYSTYANCHPLVKDPRTQITFTLKTRSHLSLIRAMHENRYWMSFKGGKRTLFFSWSVKKMYEIKLKK